MQGNLKESNEETDKRLNNLKELIRKEQQLQLQNNEINQKLGLNDKKEDFTNHNSIQKNLASLILNCQKKKKGEGIKFSFEETEQLKFDNENELMRQNEKNQSVQNRKTIGVKNKKVLEIKKKTAKLPKIPNFNIRK